MTGTNLAPGLLIAMPQLIDPNFTRSVVLMIEHNDSGSFGLVINQPSPIKAGELLDSLAMAWGGDDDTVVWSGGPVSPTTGWVLHEPLAALATDDGTAAIGPGVALSTSPERLRLLAASPPTRLRLLLGYSGWGPGQLAREMAQGSWLHADLDAKIVFDLDADAMWRAAVASLGINPDAVVVGRGVN
ncbi:MAG: YqgE/AlgH family protein [Myxococcales bacterium]|nr:YqgE/AlgH family protein [Myxococcales bacterium]